MSKKKTVTLFLAFIVVYHLALFISSVEDNVIKTQYDLDFKLAQYFLPQGWEFFTKDPMNYISTPYKMVNGKPEQINLKNFSADQLLGLNKKNRVFNHYVGKNVESIPDQFWFPYEGSRLEIPLDSVNSFKVKYGKELFKEPYLVQLTKPIPWTWKANSKNKNIQMQRFYVIIANE